MNKGNLKDTNVVNRRTGTGGYIMSDVTAYKKSSKQPKRKLSGSYGNKSLENKKVNTLPVGASVLGIVVMLLIAVSFIRVALGLGVATEPISFRALLEILQNSPVIDFASKIEIPLIDISTNWLEWIELLLNPSIRIINLLIWVASQLLNFLSFVSYMLFNLLGLNLGF